jgi:hypothetical protein
VVGATPFERMLQHTEMEKLYFGTTKIGASAAAISFRKLCAAASKPCCSTSLL